MKKKAFALPYTVWMVIFTVVPLLLVFIYAFVEISPSGNVKITFEYIEKAFEMGSFDVLLRSLWYAFITTVICLLLAYPAAMFLSQLKSSTGSIICLLFILPMWMNFLLRTYAWRALLDNNGLIIVTSSIDVAIEIADEIAPEHLELSVDEPFSYLGKVKNAGSVFLGRYCPEALGDYFAGPNHTLPTSGTARFSSPLSVDDFVKKSQYIYYTKDALNAVYKKVAAFAEKEGLSAHARSARARFEKF